MHVLEISHRLMKQIEDLPYQISSTFSAKDFSYVIICRVLQTNVFPLTNDQNCPCMVESARNFEKRKDNDRFDFNFWPASKDTFLLFTPFAEHRTSTQSQATL